MSDKPAARPDSAVGATLAAAARDILGEARAVVEETARSDAEVVHDYRKAMKRWRALLRLLEPFLAEDSRQMRIEARDLAREMAGARDTQSALDALADLGTTGEALSATTRATIRRRIEAMKHTAEATALNGTRRQRLRAAIVSAELALERWPLDRIGFFELARELAATYRRARQAAPRRWSRAESEELHDLRRRVVAHRYQMELVEPLWPRMGKLWIGEAQRLRDRLGAYQDLQVLRGLTAPHQPLAPWRSRLLPLINARQAEHAAAAAKVAGRLFAERPKAFRRRLEALWESRRMAAE